jgi:hypothetical protein
MAVEQAVVRGLDNAIKGEQDQACNTLLASRALSATT